MRPLFQLGPRMELCAGLIRRGKKLCDVGADHAYLPIWLLKSGAVKRALASDVNPGPLETAAQNARRYGVADRLVLRRSDGLRAIAAEEAEDIVIAGMGGELILRIVGETPWLRDPEKLLVLQPMSSARELRTGLRDMGFEIVEERAAEDAGRAYTAFSARYIGTLPPLSGQEALLYPYLGKLRPGTPAAEHYAEKLLRDLRGRLEGAVRGRGEDDPGELRAVMEGIEKLYLHGN